MANPETNPAGATVADLVKTCRSYDAGSMKLSGDDGKGRKVFVVLVAVDDEAERLSPELDRLTDPDCPDLCPRCRDRGRPVLCEEHEGRHPFDPETCRGAVHDEPARDPNGRDR